MEHNQEEAEDITPENLGRTVTREEERVEEKQTGC